MKTRIILIGLVMMACIGLLGAGCTRNVDYVKERSTQTAEASGFEITGYEGYKWDIFYGGEVWYIFSRVPDNGISYHGAFVRRPTTEEIHLCNLEAIDAIKP